MKKYQVLTGLFLVAALCFGMTVSACADYIHGYFRYTVSDDSVTITAYTGEESTVTVPSMIAGNPVSTIAAGAFAGNEDVVTVYLPETVTVIQPGAFSGSQSVVQAGGDAATPEEPEPQTDPPANTDPVQQEPAGTTDSGQQNPEPASGTAAATAGIGTAGTQTSAGSGGAQSSSGTTASSGTGGSVSGTVPQSSVTYTPAPVKKPESSSAPAAVPRAEKPAEEKAVLEEVDIEEDAPAVMTIGTLPAPAETPAEPAAATEQRPLLLIVLISVGALIITGVILTLCRRKKRKA